MDTSETFVTGLAILPDAIAAEAAAHDLDDVGRRWLEMPIAADPTSSAHGGGRWCRLLCIISFYLLNDTIKNTFCNTGFDNYDIIC